MAAVVLTGCGPRGGAVVLDQPQVPPLLAAVDALPASIVTVTTPDAAWRVDVRVAATPTHRQRGLMDVPRLPDGTGMLFLFDEERTGGFWMKDTLVPLDIAFIDAERRIVAVDTMTPCRRDPCPVYDPARTYVAALEVPAGWLARHAVGVGDAVVWTAPVVVPPTGDRGRERADR